MKRLLPLLFLLLLPSVALATVSTVESIAELRKHTGTVDHQAILPIGYYAAMDGGGGPIRIWSSGKPVGYYTPVTGKEPDNGGSIIVPTGGDGSAAWVWEYSGPINIKWFGARGNGVADDTKPINAALSFGAGRNIYAPSGNYLITGTVVIPPGTTLQGDGSCDQFRAATAGTTFSVSHTSSPATTIARGATIDGVNYYYPYQVVTGTPIAYDWTISLNFTVRPTDQGPSVGSGNNAGVTLKNITIHNAYKGINLGGDVNAAPATVYGSVIMDSIRMYALHTGVYSGYTLSEINVTNFIHSPLFWNKSVGQPIREWPYTNGVAIWHSEATQGAQFSNCTFFGHNRGMYFAPQKAKTSTAKAYFTFLKVTGCLFDGVRTGIEVAGNAGLGGASFSGCVINAGQFNNPAYNNCIGYYSNESLNAGYVNFSGCLFEGTAGSHVVIENTSAAASQRHQFTGCQFLNANRNNAAGRFYNIYQNDLYAHVSRAKLSIVGCYFDNTNESTVTNVKIPSINTLTISGNTFEDTLAKIFDISNVTTSFVINGNSVVSTTASTWPNASPAMPHATK